MPKITINKEKCKGCLLCIKYCPRGLIVLEEKLNRRGVRPVRFSRSASLKSGGIPRLGGGKEDTECIGCTMCALICPDCCIEVYR